MNWSSEKTSPANWISLGAALPPDEALEEPPEEAALDPPDEDPLLPPQATSSDNDNNKTSETATNLLKILIF